MRMLMGVVGLNGSGKEEFAKYLVLHHNFTHRDIGQEIRDALKREGKDFLDRNLMIEMGNAKRKEFGINYWCKLAIEGAGSKDLVITSIRNPGEIDEVVSHGGVIVEVFADQRIRFDRTVERVRNDPGKHGDVGSFEQFRETEEKELRNKDPTKQRLLECIAAAKYRINNNGSFDQLHAEVESLLNSLNGQH